MAFDEERKKCAGIFGGGTFVFLLSVAMIAIGAYHVDWGSNDPLNNNDCHLQPHIPNFLMAGGILFILGMVLRVIFMVRSLDKNVLFSFVAPLNSMFFIYRGAVSAVGIAATTAYAIL